LREADANRTAAIGEVLVNYLAKMFQDRKDRDGNDLA
jgi:hypothetical protein